MDYTNIIGQISNIDLNFANWLYALRDHLWVQVFLMVSMLGKWWVVAVIMLAVSAIFYFKDCKKYITPFFISVGGSFITGFLGKIIWQRPRPLAAVYIEHSWSFPSGHAILAMSLYGFLIYFFWKNSKKLQNKISVLFLGLLIIIAIGFSRLYLGVHYLSDVLAGYLAGVFWLWLSIAIVKNQKPKPAAIAEVVVKEEVL